MGKRTFRNCRFYRSGDALFADMEVFNGQGNDTERYLSYLLLLVLISPFPWGDTINIFKCTGKMKLIFVSDSRADICNG